MKADREYVPELPIVEKVIEVGLLPVLEQIEKEVGEKLPLEIAIYRGEMLGPLIKLHRGLGEHVEKRGTARIRFRKTFSENRDRYQIEVILAPLRAAPGFSGLLSDGEVKNEAGTISVRPKSDIRRHNVWEWQGWV